MKKRNFASDVILTFFSLVVKTTVTFFITIIIGRLLGIQQLGIYKITFTIYSLLLLLSGFGIPISVTKFIAEKSEEKYNIKSISTSSLISSLIFGIIFAIFLYLFSDFVALIFNSVELSLILKILSISIPITSVNLTLLGILNGLRKMKIYFFAILLENLLLILFTIVLIYLGNKIYSPIYAILISAIISFIFLILCCKDFLTIRIKGFINQTKKLSILGFQIFGANSINQITLYFDIILIGYFLNSTSVGTYSVAANLSMLFWIIPHSISRIVYPSISLWKKDKRLTGLIISKSLKYASLSILPISIGMWIFSSYIIRIIFGEVYLNSVYPLKILLIGSTILGILKSVASSFPAINKANINLKITFLAAISNIIMNLYLIPKYGIKGAAVATIISYLIISISLIFYLYKEFYLKINYLWYIKLFTLTSITIALVLIFNSTFISVIIFIIYTAFLLTLIDQKEFKILLNLLISILKGRNSKKLFKIISQDDK